ncbi:CPBP family intramembrane metalloprotease [Neolewinella aurantiaca]|uniref:CPBP family intramembrane metalloprotease n=1 Tax=Neolewinella aurantiaca TaxID=2602767 RepID=A0A5C7G0H2_9BACT|nr:CPBP family intramembrane glutamic endopeptidase [Neolewinella aurantiaca]TXF91663.1 CPBP family intramembrane metalloprotease [Neolewinella aurantiaca]
MRTATTANTTPVITNKVILSLIILATYFAGQFGSGWLSPLYRHLLADQSDATRNVIWNVLYYGLIPLIATVLLFGFRNTPSALGLDKGLAKGFKVAFLVTLPMLIGYAVCSGFTINISANNFYYGSISAPIFEELFFRAFLFGLLYRYAGWGMVPATILDAFVFGVIHISQGDDFASSASVFAVTSAGAVWLSWMYKEWDWNLWLVVFLHAFMNLYWMLFDMADNAAGGLWANVFRVATIVACVVWTNRRIKQARTQVQESEKAHDVLAPKAFAGAIS